VSGQWHSVSSVTTMEMCPQKYWYQYVDHTDVGERLVPVHWRFGSVLHQGLEWAYKAMLELGLTGPMTQVREQGRAGIHDAWVEYQMPTTGGELDRAIAMLDATLESLTVDRADESLGVEMRLKAPMDDGNNFIGFGDVFLRIGEEDLLIRDWKITSRAHSVDDIESDFQLLMYAWACAEMYPWARNVWVEHFYPPKVIRHETPNVRALMDPERVKGALARFEADVREIEGTTDFAPRVSSECSSCVYSHLCPAMCDSSTGVAVESSN
jgi:CRISPR/Cas system-associated exonuclease Cas4 (RecB family)